MNYTFTQHWIHYDELERHLSPSKNEFHVLEIGSFEGRSTVWFIENLLSNPNSTVTCIDPWTNYSQNRDSLNSYDKEYTDWNFAEQNTKQIFMNNILATNKQEQVKILQGLSSYVLPQLVLENKMYDLIYIDGNHTSPCVLFDAVVSWNLLKVGGLLIFDDYAWEPHREETLRPKLAADCFLQCFFDYASVEWKEYTLGVRKVK